MLVSFDCWNDKLDFLDTISSQKYASLKTNLMDQVNNSDAQLTSAGHHSPSPLTVSLQWPEMNERGLHCCVVGFISKYSDWMQIQQWLPFWSCLLFWHWLGPSQIPPFWGFEASVNNSQHQNTKRIRSICQIFTCYNSFNKIFCQVWF